MNRAFFALTSAALVAGGFAASADAALSYVRSANFGSFTVWTAYSSLADMAANVNGTSAGTSSSILSTDGVWTDGTYVYKTTANAIGVAGSYNNQLSTTVDRRVTLPSQPIPWSNRLASVTTDPPSSTVRDASLPSSWSCGSPCRST